ncbi:MAG: hypothetical protein AB2805_16985, partial [Candidatus Thiodiazotropha sp.]
MTFQKPQVYCNNFMSNQAELKLLIYKGIVGIKITRTIDSFYLRGFNFEVHNGLCSLSCQMIMHQLCWRFEA